ncbi:MAG: IclR family transcriptional regulator [Acidimicrobiia bacterium]
MSRALRILEVVGDNPAGLNAKQIAQQCNLALPTAYHLLRTLCYEGYAVRRPNGQYALGLKVADRFRDLVASMERPPQIHDVLHQLADTTGHTAYFAQLIEGHIVLTDLVEGPHSPHLEDLVVGWDDGAHATALGKALLWAIPATERHSYLKEQGLRKFTANTITDAERLNHELAVSGRVGVFTEQEQYRPEVCCAAVVVNERQGTIGMSVPAGRWDRTSPVLMRQLALRAGDLS